MCPNKSDAEWLALKENDPADFQNAVLMEQAIQRRDPHAWLHGSAQPLDQVKFEPAKAGEQCPTGECFV